MTDDKVFNVVLEALQEYQFKLKKDNCPLTELSVKLAAIKDFIDQVAVVMITHDAPDTKH